LQVLLLHVNKIFCISDTCFIQSLFYSQYQHETLSQTAYFTFVGVVIVGDCWYLESINISTSAMCKSRMSCTGCFHNYHIV